MHLGQGERLVGRPCGNYSIPHHFKHFCDDIQHRRLILHQQYCQTVHIHRLFRTVFSRRFQATRISRQINFKGRSLAWFTADINQSVILFDDTIDRRQAQAGAFANLFGGEKRFENMGQNILVHTMTSIADRHQHILSG